MQITINLIENNTASYRCITLHVLDLKYTAFSKSNKQNIHNTKNFKVVYHYLRLFKINISFFSIYNITQFKGFIFCYYFLKKKLRIKKIYFKRHQKIYKKWQHYANVL